MTVALFQPSRDDGRSDRQVIFELVRGAEPDTMFPYAQLTAALQRGTTRSIAPTTVGMACRLASRTLERECQRTLSVVRTVGYRVVRANEHLTLALDRKDRAEGLIKRGVELLEHTRLDELDEPHRTLHQGQMMIMGGFYEALRSTRRRQDAQDRVIEHLIQRVDRLEGQ